MRSVVSMIGETREKGLTMSKAVDETQRRLVATMADAMRSADPAGWAKQWADQLGTDGIPYNASTGKRYKGGNVWALLLSGLEQHYPRNAWATYKQWQSIGAQVRKGQKGTGAVKFTQWNAPDRLDPEAPRKPVMMARSFNLFNLDQVDVTDTECFARHAHVTIGEREPAPDWLARIPAEVAEGAPSYAPSVDTIMMPRADAFTSPDAHLKTYAHELGHWTGHASRLARFPNNRIPTGEAQALEELTAELCSIFVCADLDIDPTTQPDHAQYLRHWADRIESDPRALWKAAGKASAAFDYLAQWRDPDAIGAGGHPLRVKVSA